MKNTKDISFNDLLKGNREWVKKMNEADPEYFKRLSKGQKPPVLWIGCSDSRVPANQITNMPPGEIFVHRNIANLVVHTDMNMLSVLDFAVNILEVKHVVVCGHYNCGGINAAMGNIQYGLIDNWLRHIKDVYRIYQKELESIEDREQRANRFVELNVIEQVFDLAKTSIVQNSWQNNRQLSIHGIVYSLETGLIKDLGVHMDAKSNMPPVYRFENKLE